MFQTKQEIIALIRRNYWKRKLQLSSPKLKKEIQSSVLNTHTEVKWSIILRETLGMFLNSPKPYLPKPIRFCYLNEIQIIFD